MATLEETKNKLLLLELIELISERIKSEKRFDAVNKTDYVHELEQEMEYNKLAFEQFIKVNPNMLGLVIPIRKALLGN